MTGSYIRRLAMGVAAVAFSVGMAGAAHATPIVEYSTNGGSSFTNISLTSFGNSYLFAGTFGGLTVTTGSIGSNVPGGNQAQLLGDALNLANDTVSTQTVLFAFSDGGFTGPIAPPNLLLNSHIGGTVTAAGTGNLLSFLSCVTPGANAGTTSCLSADSTAAGKPDIRTANSFSNDQYATFTSLSGPYGLTELMSVTLSPNAGINYSANSTLSAVPEPMSVALMGVGLLGLTIVYRRRRQA